MFSVLRLLPSSSSALRRSNKAISVFNGKGILMGKANGTSLARYSTTFGYTQARALVYSKYGPPQDRLQLHSYSVPAACGSEILIRFLAAPINPSDINQIEGTYPTKPTFGIELGTTEPVAVGGNEGVAEVVSVGASVDGFTPGDLAIMRQPAFGTWRSHALTAADKLLKLPPAGDAAGAKNSAGLSAWMTAAATVSVNPCTAYRLLKDFGNDGRGLQPGDVFIQNGANSGAGRAAIQLGRLWGFKSINLVRPRVDSGDTQALKDELHALGADEVLTYDEAARDALAGDDVKARLPRAKLMLNCVGGKDAFKAHAFLADGADVITYGGMSRSPMGVHAGNLIFKDLRYRGFWLSRWVATHPPEDRAAMVTEILGLVRAGTFIDQPVLPTTWRPETPEEDLKGAVLHSMQPRQNVKQLFVFAE